MRQNTIDGNSLTVRPMAPEELDPFLRATARGYAEFKVSSGVWAADGAYERALESSRARLPGGVATTGMMLLSAIVERSVVGGVWLGAIAAEPPETAWLYEIEINADRRGRGYGRALLSAAEEAAVQAGYTSIGLHVFGHNVAAVRLYESEGYDTRSLQMVKRLGSQPGVV